MAITSTSFKKGNKINLGREHTEKWKRDMSEMFRGENNPFYGKTHTREARKKMSSTRTGKKFSEEHKRKISDGNKGRISSMKGKKHSEESKRKISQALKGKMPENIKDIAGWNKGLKRWWDNPAQFKKGKDHILWKDGKSFEPYTPEWTKTLKLAIRQRDNFTCQKCGITEEEHLEKLGRVLSVNHIDYDKTNCDPKNLNTLCVGCNSSVNTNREYWTNFFQQQMQHLSN